MATYKTHKAALDSSNDTNQFYDAVADHYHLFYRDWQAALDREGIVLRRKLAACKAETVLDASCGPGTQALALARLGFKVTAADINQTMLDKARANARRFKVADKITFVHAGFLELGYALDHKFDALVTKGNALPHLLTDGEIKTALHHFHKVLKPGGLLIIGIRDFDMMDEDRARYVPGQFHDDPDEQHILFDIWDWDDGPPTTVTFHKFIVSGLGDDYRVQKNSVRYRVLRRAELEAMLTEVGFTNISIEVQNWELVFAATRST